MNDMILSNNKTINSKNINEVIHITYTYLCQGYAGHVACRVAVVMLGRIVVVMLDMLSIEFAGSYMHSRKILVVMLIVASSSPSPLFVIARSLSPTIIHPS